MNTQNNQVNNNQEDQANQAINVAGQDFEIIGGVACPIDPMERLQCDSCQ